MPNNHMRTRFILLCTLAVMLLHGSVCLATPLRVAVEGSIKTLDFSTSEGEAAGVLVDLWKAWGEQNQIEIEFVVIEAGQTSKALKNRHVDIVANARTAEGMVKSKQYLTHDYYLFTEKGHYLDTLQSFPARVGILESDITFLEKSFLKNVQLQTYPNHKDMLQGMFAGDVDFMVANDIHLYYSISGTDLIRLNYPEQPFYSSPIRAASLEKNQPTIESFNHWISTLEVKTYKSIIQAWRPGMIGHKLPWPLIGLAIFILFVSFMAIIFWIMNVKLVQTVSEQTLELSTQKKALEQDIEQRKLLEKELLLAKTQADAATAAKAIFLANMTHELRTPLVGVLGMNELLFKTQLNEEQMSLVDTVQKSGEMLLSLVNNILDFSKIESNNLVLHNVPVDIAKAFEETTLLFSEQAAKKGLELSFQAAPKARLMVSSDPLRLRQILINLISNAIKFTHHGSIIVRLDMALQTDNLGPFTLEVKDTGTGIKAEDQKSIFTPFLQIDSAFNRIAGGTGLGLSIVRQIVDLMNGELGVESSVGQGSLFRVTIPLPLLRREDIKETSPVTERPEATQRTQSFNQDRRILIADDYAVTRQLVRHFLEPVGLIIDEAATGEEVIIMTRSQSYDLILMDCNMPVMDGIETTRQLRKAGSKIPIIALTAHVDSRIHDDCLAAGMNSCLSKPFRRKDLEAVVNNCLSEG